MQTQTQIQIAQDVSGVPNSPEFAQVADVFFEDFRLRPLCNNYVPLALGHDMLAVRRATGDRRPRVHQIPQDIATTIGVFSRYEEDVPLIPGTVIWGLQVVRPDDDAAGDNDLQNYYLRITDLQTGVQLFSEFLSAVLLDAQNTDSTVDPDGLPLILPQPLMILAPGMVLVEIGTSGVATAALNFQILLLCSEPVFPCVPSPAAVGSKGGIR
jgi:hypothetical protein